MRNAIETASCISHDVNQTWCMKLGVMK